MRHKWTVTFRNGDVLEIVPSETLDPLTISLALALTKTITEARGFPEMPASIGRTSLSEEEFSEIRAEAAAACIFCRSGAEAPRPKPTPPPEGEPKDERSTACGPDCPACAALGKASERRLRQAEADRPYKELFG